MLKLTKTFIAQNSATKPFSQQSRCSIVWESCRSYLDEVLNCLNCLQLGFKYVNSFVNPEEVEA